MEDFLSPLPLLLWGPSFDCGDWPFLPADDWAAEKKKKEANEMGDQPTARSRPKKMRLCRFFLVEGQNFGPQLYILLSISGAAERKLVIPPWDLELKEEDSIEKAPSFLIAKSFSRFSPCLPWGKRGTKD